MPATLRFCACVQVIILGFNLAGRWKLRHIPGPRPTFLYGALLSVRRSRFEPFNNLNRCGR